MRCPREEREELELSMLSPRATLATQSKGRERDEQECTIRTCFQRDVDRITHSTSFRRLKHKTQVFLLPEGDHYRTRLTHTLEVARIGRTIARALRLNEDLAEAIALGHDLGHTPFGHAGERALDEIIRKEGFRHNAQSLRVVETQGRDGAGLNLTYEVKNGILCHTGEMEPETLEGSVIRLSDRIAYLNHDVDDAIRAGILRESEIPAEITDTFGKKNSERINALTLDVINESEKSGEISLSLKAAPVFDIFYDFMVASVYRNMKAKSEEHKVFGILNGLFTYYVGNPGELPDEFREIIERDGLQRAVCDYISGMTDKFAIIKYGELFIPEGWKFG